MHVFEGMPWEAPFREVEALMGSLGGRPHWGKRSFLTAAELAPRYPAWDAFQAARQELDPDGRFENEWARRVLGAARQRNVAALAAVGRDGRPRPRRPGRGAATSKRSHSSPALAWRNHTRSPIRSAGGAPAEQRGLDLAGALLAVEPQAGRQDGRGEPVAARPAPDAG